MTNTANHTKLMTASSLTTEDIDGYLPRDSTFSTRAIHSGYNPLEWDTRAMVSPIVLSTTFAQPAPGEPVLYEYSRSDNPTRDVLQKSLASLDNGQYGLCYASGLGALTAVVSLFKSGDHIICLDDVYGGTHHYFNKAASQFMFDLSFFNFKDLTELSKFIKPTTKLVWLECPTNPLLKIVDIEAVVKAVKLINKSVLVAVDNTFLTPYFQKPLNLGADLVMYSLTKYMNGHADVNMGAVVVNDEKVYSELKSIQNDAGSIPSPFDCYLVDRGLKTLELRMEKHMRSGLRVAKFLESHSMVKKVCHPGLNSHPEYELAKKQWSGCSGMLSFYLNGDGNACKLFLSKLKLFHTADSLGGFESLAAVPELMSHAQVSPEVRKALGITENLIRLSVGLEAVEDLIEDLSQALNSLKK